jgi:hypothetical protein
MNSENQQIPLEYQPISMWGYFGYRILLSIPCIGFICILIFAFGGTQNINLKNFARSYFCSYIVAFIIIILLMLTGVSGALLTHIN